MNKKIIYFTLFYVVFASLALFSVISIENYAIKRSAYMDSLVSNAHAKMDILSHVKINIGNLKYYAYGYSVSDSFSETDKYERSIAGILGLLRKNLDILSSGGTVEETVPVGAPNSFTGNYKIKYEKLYEEGYDLNIIEMRALLAELTILTDDFRNLLSNKIIAEQSGNLPVLNLYKRKLSVDEKELQTFFNVFSGSADRYYLSAVRDIAVLEKFRSDQMKTLNRIKNYVCVICAFLCVAAGIMLFVHVARMFRENSDYRIKVGSMTENFNDSLAARTKELSAELAERTAELSVFKTKYKELKRIFESLTHPFMS